MTIQLLTLKFAVSKQDKTQGTLKTTVFGYINVTYQSYEVLLAQFWQKENPVDCHAQGIAYWS